MLVFLLARLPHDCADKSVGSRALACSAILLYGVWTRGWVEKRTGWRCPLLWFVGLGGAAFFPPLH